LEQWEQAKGAFRDIISQPASNQSERDLQDAAKVKLGHIYFGESGGEGLLEATRLYAQVTNVNSPFYEEAVLAYAWSLLKVNRTAEARNYISWIIRNRPDSYLISEAYLVEGYCHYLENNMNAAIASLDRAIALTDNPTISQAQKDSARTAFDAMKAGFDNVQIQALELARQLPTPRVEQKRAALRPEFERANREIENFADFQQRVIQSDRFEASRQRVSLDARFTRVSALQKRGTQPSGPAPSTGLEDLEDL
jgi:tetratricopeptide (TPR) repeat protein